jgi:uncharacterized protein (TIGR01777 family)
MKKILITGGTGFLGKALTLRLLAEGYEVTVLTRTIEALDTLFAGAVKGLSSLAELTPDDTFDIVINLAGAPIFDARWSEARQQIIRDSRIKLTRELVACMAQMTPKPALLISGSAIGYYGNQGDEVLAEDSNTKVDFSQQLCADWEAEAKKAEAFNTRVCVIRTGLVLGEGGGLLQRMLLPFKLGLGGRLGSGRQWMSWIHLNDWLAIVSRMINEPSMHGAYNATSPYPVTNREFTETLAQSLHRPALLPVPACLLKMLLGEMSELVLGGQQVYPERLLLGGYKFQYAQLSDALQSILKQS